MFWDHAMAFSDRLLLEFLRHKASHLEGTRLRYEELARHTGISERTVRRSVNRLSDAGLIVITREPGDSYVYRVVNSEQQSA